jgi:hypothetical protein
MSRLCCAAALVVAIILVLSIMAAPVSIFFMQR